MSEKTAGLFKDTFGCIVDIKGSVRDLILMLNNPTKYEDMANGSIDPNSKSLLMTTFQKGKLQFEVEEDSCFCISLSDKIFIQSQKLNVITTPEGAYIEEVILAFPGLDGFKNALWKIKDYYGLQVVDLCGAVSQYEGFDTMIDAFAKRKMEVKQNVSN